MDWSQRVKSRPLPLGMPPNRGICAAFQLEATERTTLSVSVKTAET